MAKARAAHVGIGGESGRFSMTAAGLPIWVRTKGGVAFEDVPTRPGGRMADFCIIGAAKAGTSALDSMLAQHPGIFMTPLKEPHFWSTEAMLARGEDWYRGLFAEAADGQICGEASTSYTRLPLTEGTAARMARANPAMRLIYIVRDPVERVESEALQSMKYAKNVLGLDHTDMPLDDFLDMVEKPSSALYSAIVETSRYAGQLAAFEDEFPSAQIHVLAQDRLQKDPAGTLSDIFAFLGVPDHPVEIPRQNVTDVFRRGVQNQRKTRILKRIPGYRLVRDLLPARAKKTILARSGTREDTMRLSPARKERLRAHLEPDVASLRERYGLQ